MPASLVLGPMLRFVSEREAVFWVETDRACEVEVLGASARTFCVHGHHYALVHATGLEPGTRYEYELLLDGERAWPEPWRLTGGGPWFDNQYGVLTVEGRRIDLRIEKAVPEGDEGESKLERVLDRRLA